MAVTKTITYLDSGGKVLTTTLTFDLAKIAIGPSADEEQVFLVGSAPGLSSENYWRKNIDKLVEDAIFAASGVLLSSSRYVQASGEWSAYGDKIVNTGSGLINGVSGVVGLRQQLITNAG